MLREYVTMNYRDTQPSSGDGSAYMQGMPWGNEHLAALDPARSAIIELSHALNL